VARARLLHPDAGGDDDAAMRAANQAWNVLRDPARRLAHDRDLGIDHGPRYDDWRPWESVERDTSLAPEPPMPPRATRAGDLLVLVPPGLLALAVVCFALGAVMLNANLLACAVGALLLSGVTFAVTPFLTLARDRRRLRR
jgi:curved DNA-binding protein CbpA